MIQYLILIYYADIIIILLTWASDSLVHMNFHSISSIKLNNPSRQRSVNKNNTNSPSNNLNAKTDKNKFSKSFAISMMLPSTSDKFLKHSMCISISNPFSHNNVIYI